MCQRLGLAARNRYLELFSYGKKFKGERNVGMFWILFCPIAYMSRSTVRAPCVCVSLTHQPSPLSPPPSPEGSLSPDPVVILTVAVGKGRW